MVDIRLNPLQPNLTEGKGKWHCLLLFLNFQNLVEVTPSLLWNNKKKELHSHCWLWAVLMFSTVVECKWNKASCDPLSFSSLTAIHPPPSFIFNFCLFIARELSLLSGPLEQGPAMNEGTAVGGKWTFGIFIISVGHSYVSCLLLLHYTTSIFFGFMPDDNSLYLYFIKKWNMGKCFWLNINVKQTDLICMKAENMF